MQLPSLMGNADYNFLSVNSDPSQLQPQMAGEPCRAVELSLPQAGPGAREDPVIPSLPDLPPPQLCGMKLRRAAAASPWDSVCDLQLWVHPGPGREARLHLPQSQATLCVCSPRSRGTPGERGAIRPRCALRTQEGVSRERVAGPPGHGRAGALSVPSCMWGAALPGSHLCQQAPSHRVPILFHEACPGLSVLVNCEVPAL